MTNKMKMARLAALLLALCLTVSALVSCSDSTVPEGMQLACPEDVEYAFYVPRNWTVNQTGHVPSAYVSPMDRSNVSITSYMPETGMSTEEYWELCREAYAAEFDGFKVVANGTTAMSGQTVPYYIYSANVGGSDYQFLQAILGTSGLFYSFTYTAEAENFDKYAEDVLHMIEVFTLK